MPFGQPFDRYYENIIAPAVVDANLEPARADSLFTSTQIIEDIWGLTRKAKVLIGDLTGKNPNVFYELGLAHAIGKPVVLIASSIEDVPFDLRALRVIIYNKENESWGVDLRKDIIRALRETLKNVALAVPLPFVERKEVERPKEDSTSYEIRRLWDELRALRSQQVSGMSITPNATAADVAQYIAELKAGMLAIDGQRVTDALLARAFAQVLASRYIDAVKTIRDGADLSLADAKNLMDRMRAVVERGAT